jgi:hypothetical protein
MSRLIRTLEDREGNMDSRRGRGSHSRNSSISRETLRDEMGNPLQVSGHRH